MVSYTYSLSSLVCLEEPPILLYLIFPCHLYYVIGRNRLPIVRGRKRFDVVDEAMRMVGYNVDIESVVCNETMWRVSNVGIF